MRSNKNSKEWEIIEYIVISSFSFLYLYSDESCAQPHFDEAAKIIPKEHLKYFLEKLADRFSQYICLTLSSLEK